jgi:small subunit ribosomal protein S17
VKQRSKEGIVIRKKLEKTAVVQVERVIRHPKYSKVLKVYKNFQVHDPKNQCQEGNRVLIAETRPLSSRKRFKLLKVLETAKLGARA